MRRTGAVWLTCVVTTSLCAVGAARAQTPPPATTSAPAPAPAPARTYLVFFDWDRSVLTPRARQIVAEAAANSRAGNATRIEVDGYADTSHALPGERGRDYNLRLSMRRADAVRAELVRDGVPGGTIAVHGFGDTHLLVATGPNVREPQNRRVEILLPGAAPVAAPPPAAPPAAAAAPPGIVFAAQLDAGITGNLTGPNGQPNFGRLFDDKANTVLLNAVQLTASKALNPAATGYDVGFTLQGEYGTDARYTHYLGEFDYATSDREQFSLLQANVVVHTPWLTAGGVDFKLGQFLTPIGFETIDPSTNPFYSHSYLFNFGPFEHTGLQGIWHVSPLLDVYVQADTGESTTFDGGDENAEPAGLVGVGLNNMLGGKLTVLWLTHLGPEDATNAIGTLANSEMRYESDVVATYKPGGKWSFAGEGQWQHEDSTGAEFYGAAVYASYTLTPTLTANARAEAVRDNGGFFVAAFPGNLDAVRALDGRPSTAYGAGSQTYGELTFGVTYKPTIPHVTLLAFRPEVRWDHSLSGGHPFDGVVDDNSLTLAGDIILGF